MSDFDEEKFEEEKRAFDLEVNEAIRELAAKHFTSMFLRAHVLTIGLWEAEEDRERVDVLPPDGQSSFTTAGLLSNAHYLMIK